MSSAYVITSTVVIAGIDGMQVHYKNACSVLNWLKLCRK